MSAKRHQSNVKMAGDLPINCQAYPASGRYSKPEVGPMSECPSARCQAAVGFDWHLVGIQVVTRRRPAVSMSIGSLSGLTAALLATRPWSAVGPRIGSWSGQCWICSAYTRHLLSKPTSARCRHFSPARRRADARFNRHLVGMLRSGR